MSIILTEADLATLAQYPMPLREAARALWLVHGKCEPADRHPKRGSPSSDKRKHTGAS